MDIALVGVDGLDPELVERWRSDLPTIDRLCSAGSVGRLRSADPPLTSPAWPTLYTGKQGGKHGVFGFTKRSDGSYDRVPVNYDDVRAESLWEILDDAGVSCGVVNVPLTYPPSDLDHGFVLSGWPVPKGAAVSEPAGLVDELEAELGAEYRVNPFPLTVEFDQLENEELYDRISDGLWHHHRAFASLLDSRDLDVFFCVYMAIDIASHNFAWDLDRLREMYIEQDRALGELLATIPEETNVILLSDHGHGAQGTHSFHVNEWLRQEGYLVTHGTEGEGSSSTLGQLGITQENYVRVKNALGLGDVHEKIPAPLYDRLKRVIPRDKSGDAGFEPGRIDWSETVAYSGAQNELFVNTTAHPQGTVPESDAESLRQELKDALLEIQHPDDPTESLMSQVATKTELFEGPFLADAPDLVFIADEMRCNAPVGFADGAVLTDERWGEHRQYGTLITEGPAFATASDVADADITDVLPLVLGLVDTAMPENVDGDVPADRLVEPVTPATRESRDAAGATSEYSSDDSRDVEEQLEGLGYLE